MIFNFTEKQVINAIESSRDGVKKYIDLMGIYNNKNISHDLEFRRKFNHFYRMKMRSREYYDDYFSYLEKYKGKELNFEETLGHFKERFNRLEASFSSKLVATINPNYAVWDQHVLRNMSLIAPRYNNPNRQESICDIYVKLNEKMNDIVKSEEGKKLLKIFNKIIPNTKITNIKKIDFILWQLR